jgi:ABC-type oligopeptide transport system substrate-binding subunit
MTSKTSLRLLALSAILASALPLAACDSANSTSPDKTYPQDRAITAPGTTASPATPSNSGR